MKTTDLMRFRDRIGPRRWAAIESAWEAIPTPEPLDPSLAERLRALWDAQPQPAYLAVPRWIVWACEGCLDLASFNLETCEKWEQDQVFVAALDADPDGENAVKEAAVRRLREIGVVTFA